MFAFSFRMVVPFFEVEKTRQNQLLQPWSLVASRTSNCVPVSSIFVCATFQLLNIAVVRPMILSQNWQCQELGRLLHDANARGRVLRRVICFVHLQFAMLYVPHRQ